MVLWYFEYVNFNYIGLSLMGMMIWVVILGVVSKMVVCFFILVVLMGYGVVCFIFGGLILKVFIFGLIYFLVVEVLDVVENVGIINDLLGKVCLFLVFLVVILEVIFVFWIFMFFFSILEKL